MGAPIGNNNATKNRLWTLAIQKAIERRSSKKDQLEALIELAENLLAKVDEKDMTAIKELGDRLEGKPHQTIGGDTPNGEIPISMTVKYVGTDR